MPTATEFDQAASELDVVAVATDGLMGPVAAGAGPEVLSGGRLGATLDQFIDDQTAEAKAIGADFQELADECRRRATVTREAEKAQADYEAAVARHEQELAEVADNLRAGGVPEDEIANQIEIIQALGFRRPPEPPPTPPPWAEF